jgi:CO dehydrogenase/acetyl-CoA synthase gamma subunit (corrinoid Fe-S protein)
MENKEITITLAVKEVDQILALLSKRPLDEVIDLFNKIRAQGVAQIAVEPPKEPEPNE